MREEIRRIDPTIPVFQLQTMDELMGRTARFSLDRGCPIDGSRPKHAVHYHLALDNAAPIIDSPLNYLWEHRLLFGATCSASRYPIPVHAGCRWCS